MKIRIVTRPAIHADIEGLCTILNQIIEIGGTTAFESPLSDVEFDNYFLSGPHFIWCHVAESDGGELLGFQSLARKSTLPAGWADIATFARGNPKVRGVGTLLFQETLDFAKSRNFKSINATIRADNVPGLAYYSKMGFTDYAREKAVPLCDGTPVDRIYKQFTIEKE